MNTRTNTRPIMVSAVAMLIIEASDEDYIKASLKSAARESSSGWGNEMTGPYHDDGSLLFERPDMGKWRCRHGWKANLRYGREYHEIRGTLEAGKMLLSERSLILMDMKLPETLKAMLLDGSKHPRELVTGIRIANERVIDIREDSSMTVLTMDVPTGQVPLPEKYICP